MNKLLERITQLEKALEAESSSDSGSEQDPGEIPELPGRSLPTRGKRGRCTRIRCVTGSEKGNRVVA